ncbi:MAG: ABC transporter permease [Lachnospiraceae bacterium]|nr:ABC transporter permease [Butyrivibrio sp.]MBR0172392.1 ABC transporter permease [Lachnospiraceae bacterium]MBR0173732.1 ABC transporter permease [Lachnospiraceae bacterium]
MENRKIDLQKLLAPVVLVILYVLFAIIGKGFFTADTLKTILESSYYIGFMAFGVTFIIITGGIDLSLGTVMMCSALLGAYTFKVQGWPLILSLVLTVLVGMLFGFMNGIFVAKLKLPPFISTLGSMMMAQGVGSVITKVQSQTWPTATDPTGGWFKKVFIRYQGMPVGAIWLIAFFIIATLILHKTKFGRYVFAIGSNEEAARLSGINVDNWKVAVYTLSGFFVGMAGIFYAAAYTTITPGTGNGQEMNGITGAVIGGVSMAGGSGSMVGTMIGVFIMSVLKNGLASCGLQAPWQTFFTGLVVILAVLLDNYRTRAANRVKKS